MQKTKLLLAIRSLDVGGAERQFIELVKNIDKSRFDVTVCTMYGGKQEDIIKEIEGIKYFNLNKKGRYDIFGFLKRYKEVLKSQNPCIIYSFMAEANIFSYFPKPSNTKIIWGLRASDMKLENYGLVSKSLFYIENILSKRVDRVISNAKSSLEYREKFGFDISKATVIPNGIDIDRFNPDSNLRDKFRDEFKLKKSDIAVAMVARQDIMKGHIYFAKAIRELVKRYPNLYFFAVGSRDFGIEKECNIHLKDYIGSRFFYLDAQRDIEKVYNGIDILVSASIYGEGFSNSIAEAMSCATPCIVTDVGDSAYIVNNCGAVVEKESAESIVRGIEEMLKRDLKKLGLKSRERIVKYFSIKQMVEKSTGEIDKLCAE